MREDEMNRKTLVSKKDYKTFLDYGFVPDELIVVEEMPSGKVKQVNTKHYMKFQKAKRG